MKLLPLDLVQRFAQVGSQEGVRDPLVVAKYFTPDASATWYATEYDPAERMFFGWANLGDPSFAEFGYFSLDELETTRAGALRLPIERDLYCGERRLSEHPASGFTP